MADQEFYDPTSSNHVQRGKSSAYEVHSSVTPSLSCISSGEEMLHASFMSSTGSAVRVEITDAEESLLPSTAAALRRCKKQVLQPYWRLLSLIGWRAFGREIIFYSRWWKCINIIYPIFITLLLLFTYTYQVLACQGGIDINDPSEIVTEAPLITRQSGKTVVQAPDNNSDTSSVAMTTPLQGDLLTVQSTTWIQTSPANLTPHCYHIFTSHVVPDILHFMAFCLGFLIFRVQENEELNALIEHTFLQASPLQTGSITQANMIKSMRCILIFGGIWTLSTLGLHGLFLGAFNVYKSALLKPLLGSAWHYVILAVQMIGILVLNSVNTAVVINYATQCEMLIYYISAIDTRLKEKTADLRVVMQDVLRVKQSISRLNGPIARMTSLCVVNFAELAIIGLCLLILNKFTEPMVWAYRSCFVLVWVMYLLFPLVQGRALLPVRLLGSCLLCVTKLQQ
ncbi:uncharacterized protein [Ptychodera flava]|uniref:uncharacterized protein isoform X2 n=1 Tax=Ptychodera flava TaxID=63121 RepID=UPI00396A8EB6